MGSRTGDSRRSEHGPGLQRRKSSSHTSSICEESSRVNRRGAFGWRREVPIERGSEGRCKDCQMQYSEEDQDALSKGIKALHLYGSSNEWKRSVFD